MSATFRTLGQSELLPRYIFAESLYARRRVLEIGAVASTLGQSARFLSTRGARVVVAADSDLGAVQDAQARLSGPNLRFRAPVYDDLETGSFDLVIVADLAPYVRAPELLKELVRLVAKNGYVMGGLRNPAGLSLANVMEAEGVDAPPTYGQLLDSFSTYFKSIEVATQSPVLGYQLAFEKGEGLQVDGSLAGNAEAAYYVVLAGNEPVRFFDPTWVQLPPEPLAFTGGKLEDASARARNWQERSDRLKEALNKTRDEAGAAQSELKEIREQLEGSKEAIARLTAQIESVTQRPKENRVADDLTQRVRRLEAELVVARERAIDSEGRVAAMREEVALHQREQKNATVETLAAHEQGRLERSRREQLATELEDARTRLTQAYEDLRRHQDDAAGQRVEAERAKLAADRISEQLALKNRELEGAREKELRLAEARSESMQAVEHLQGELQRATAAREAAEEASRAREAEKIAALRTLDLETQKHTNVDAQLQNARAQVKDLADELREREGSLQAAETELQSVKAAATRLQRDIETLSNSERTWREMAQSYEQRLNDTLANVETLSEQVARLDSEKEQEVARFHRLEKDLTTAIGAERSARDQAQSALADLQQKLQETENDRERLLEARDELSSLLSGERNNRASSDTTLAETRATLENTQQRLNEADAALTSTRAQLERSGSDLFAARSQLETTAQSLAETRTVLEATQARLKETEHDREVLVEERDDLKGSIDDLQKLRAADQASLESAANYRAALDARLGQLEGEVHELGDKLAARAAEADRLAEELHVALEKVERTEGDVAQQLKATEARANELTRERDQARQEGARLSGQLDQGRQRVADLAQRSARLENEAQGLKARIAELEAQSKDRQERLQETQVKFTHASQAASTLERELREQLGALTVQLREAQEAAAAEKAALEAQLRTALAQLDESRSKGVDAGRELEQVRDSLAATEAARLRVEGLLEGDRKESLQARSELEAQLGQSKEQIGRLEARLEVLASESKVLQHELDVQLRRYQLLEEQGRQAAAEAEVERTRVREVAERMLAEAREAADTALQAAEGASQQRIAVLQQEIEHFKADRLELEGRLITAQAHSEHLDAELAESAEGRAAEAQLREKAEVERDGLRAELDAARAAAATANEWVVGGKTENEKLAAQMKATDAELETTREQLAASRKGFETTQAELAAIRDQAAQLQKSVDEREREKIDLGDLLSKEKAELGLARQQAEAARADVSRGQTELEKLRADLDELQKRMDAQLQAQRDELLAKNLSQQRETDGLREQLESAKKEVELQRANGEKAHSEARGHQAGKLQLQRELDGLRGELTQVNASLAAAGGEAKAIAESRAAAQAELEKLQQRAQEAEGRAVRAEGGRDALQSELAALQERQVGLEAEISAAKGAASGSAGELEAAMAGRRQAEDLLIKMRTRYAELELQLQTEVPGLREQVNELMGDNQLLDAERERLAAQVERLEATKTSGADAEKELKTRIDMLQRRVNAQETELAALRRRPAAPVVNVPSAPMPPIPPKSQSGILPPRPSVPVVGQLLEDEPPTMPGGAPPKPAVPPRLPVHTAVTPVMTPQVRDALKPKPPQPTPPGDDVELEVFELELDENGDDEELLLLDEEASDPGPGSKKP